MFKVLGSTAQINAAENTDTNLTGGVPIYWYQGDKVADDNADLYDGACDSNAPRDENGAEFPSNNVFVSTGSDSNGQSSGPHPLRASGSTNVALVKTSGQELVFSPQNVLHRLYALSQALTVPTPPTSLVVTLDPAQVNEGAGATEITVTAAFNAGATPPGTPRR